MVEQVWIPDANQMCQLQSEHHRRRNCPCSDFHSLAHYCGSHTEFLCQLLYRSISIPLGALLLLENVFDHISLFCFMTSVSKQGIYHL